ncbi:MAG: LPP20 family lipoprotein [Planctomycetota bacterium]|nr:LPP20 family lipoprotein [Planctomycetota bacterium]MDI6786846.1 LPP20 family lipoprotein [Planctomycetota bacterium]
MGNVFEKTSAPKPEWLPTHQHPNFKPPQYILGIGVAKDTGNIPEDSSRADAAARTEIAHQLITTISSNITIKRLESNINNEWTFSTETLSGAKVSTSLKITGITIVDRYHDKKEKVHYTLAVLDKTTASYQEIREDLDKLASLLNPIVGNPRIALLIEEIRPDGSKETGSPIISNALSQGLIEQGYTVLNPSELAPLGGTAKVIELLKDNTDYALRLISQKVKAEIIIIGRTSATPITSPELDGLISFRGVFNARALKTTTGQVLATVSTSGSAVDITQDATFQITMNVLGKNAAKDLGVSLLSLLTTRPSITLIAKEVSTFKELLNLKEILNPIDGLGKLYLRSFSDGRAEIEIIPTSATATDIAKELSKKGYTVTNQTHDTLEITGK